MSRNKGRAAKVKRREDAEQRTAAWRALTPAQQIAALDKWFGVGQGASRQRARLAKV